MPTQLRWGILGTGNIARQFSRGVAACDRGVLGSVGSRSVESAHAFAGEFGLSSSGTYDDVLNDPSIDAVYNALPNAMHHPWTLKALRAGKHVLCEKPFALDEAEAAEMFDAAERAGRVVVEAFMYRSNPLMHAVEKAVTGGAIGELRLVRTSFCYRTTKIDGNVRFDRSLGGGALMDIGCYCTNFTRLFACEPSTLSAYATFHPSGVDQLVVGNLQFPSGILASFTCGMNTQADNTAYLCGSEGFIEIPVPWKPPTPEAVYVIARGTPPKMDGPARPSSYPPPREVVKVHVDGELYGIEADDFARTVLDGAPPAITKSDTLGNMRTLDRLREAIGLRFHG